MSEGDPMIDLNELLQDLTDPTPCSLDHHGYCQAHSWMNEAPCPQARLRDLAWTYPLSILTDSKVVPLVERNQRGSDVFLPLVMDACEAAGIRLSALDVFLGEVEEAS